MKWYLLPWKRYADFSGRSRRMEYFSFALGNFLIAMLLMIIMTVTAIGGAAAADSGEGGFAMFGASSSVVFLYIAFALATLIPSLAVLVRRLHDAGKSGWMALVSLIPIIGAIWLLILLFTDSQPDNKWGPNPKASQTLWPAS